MHNFGIRVLCARAFQNKIEESVYSLLKDKAYLLGVSNDFKFLKSSIVCNRTGGKAVFYGLNRNIDEIKSLENITICWIEEAQFITEEQFNVLIPTIRGKKSEIWISFNPKNKNDYIYKRFILNHNDSSIVRKINYTENPFAPKVLIDEANSLRELDETLYSHVYLGEILNDSNNKFFKNVIFLPHRLDSFERIYIGFDVSDGGKDPHAIIRGCKSKIARLTKELSTRPKALTYSSPIEFNPREQRAVLDVMAQGERTIRDIEEAVLAFKFFLDKTYRVNEKFNIAGIR